MVIESEKVGVWIGGPQAKNRSSGNPEYMLWKWFSDKRLKSRTAEVTRLLGMTKPKRDA